MKCLIVIDMQWFFESAQESWLIGNITNKIKKYIMNREPIIVVQYTDVSGMEDIGPTISEILEAISGYQYAWVINKHNDDGAEEIDKALRSAQIDNEITEFEVCGVNLDCCVAATVGTMAEDYWGIPIKVVLDCCNSTKKKYHAVNSFNDTMARRYIINVELVDESGIGLIGSWD